MRRPRGFEEGIFHIAGHGSDLRHLFVEDRDRIAFLHRLAAACERYELPLLSYVLMGTHYHALLRVRDRSASHALQWLHTGYSRDHNRRHERRAHLFRAHPLARQIESDAHLISSVRYLARNPVEAGLVDAPLEWRWSSARAHAGLQRAPIPLHEHDLEAAFGGTGTWRHRYREEIQKESPPERAFVVAGAGFEPATSGL